MFGFVLKLNLNMKEKIEREEIWHFEGRPTVYVTNRVIGHSK